MAQILTSSLKNNNSHPASSLVSTLLTRNDSTADHWSKMLSAPRLNQIHDHDLAVAERNILGVALLLHAFDLYHILKKYRRKLVEAVIDDTGSESDLTQ